MKPKAPSINIESGLIGHTKQNGSLMNPTIPASVPKGPPGRVPEISSVPKMAYELKIKLKIKKIAIIIYLNCPNAVFVFSEKLKCLFPNILRKRLIRSMYSPNGHNQPQKNLPKITAIMMLKLKTMTSFSTPDVE